MGDNARQGDQLQELQAVWGAEKTLSRMDYVTGWYAQATNYYPDRRGEFAFVSTNSIVQGDQVHRLFPPVYDAGWKIKFAHRTFAWTSEAAAKERAVVHCVIIGFTRDAATVPRLFDYETLKGPPIELRPKTVNAYLVDGPEVWVTKRQAPLHAGLPDVAYGSKPTDGSHFLIEDEEELAQVLTDTVAAKYVRPFVGARELIHGEQRWCLWLVDLVPGDVTRSPVLRDRIAAVRDFRLASKARSTRQYPHHRLFRQVAQPDVPYLCIPAHFSESRAYATVARLSPDVIAGNANFTCPDPDGFAFGIIESSMFLTWQKTVGGRIKSDLRFSKTTSGITCRFHRLMRRRVRPSSPGESKLKRRGIYTQSAHSPSTTTR